RGGRRPGGLPRGVRARPAADPGGAPVHDVHRGTGAIGRDEARAPGGCRQALTRWYMAAQPPDRGSPAAARSAAPGDRGQPPRRGSRPATLSAVLRWLTAGEPHGPSLVAVLEGVPAGVEVTSTGI